MKLKAIILLIAFLVSPVLVVAEPVELLAPTTSATQSDEFDVSGTDSHSKLNLQVTISIGPVSSMAAGKYVDLQECLTENAATGACTLWQDVWSADGVQARLHSTYTSFQVKGQGRYRMDKDATTASVGVYKKDRRNK